MSLLIGKGDTIFLRDVQLDNEPIVVEWQKFFVTRTERYIQAEYRDSMNSEIKGQIFIQVSKANEFRHKHDRSKDMYTVRIDRDFLYGQNKEQRTRFLVFHNKNNKPHQCRFVESAMAAAGGKAATMARSLGIESGKDIVEWAKKYMGDDLREF